MLQEALILLSYSYSLSTGLDARRVSRCIMLIDFVSCQVRIRQMLPIESEWMYVNVERFRSKSEQIIEFSVFCAVICHLWYIYILLRVCPSEAESPNCVSCIQKCSTWMYREIPKPPRLPKPRGSGERRRSWTTPCSASSLVTAPWTMSRGSCTVARPGPEPYMWEDCKLVRWSVRKVKIVDENDEVTYY